MQQYPVTKVGVGVVPHRLHEALRAAAVPVQTVLGTGADTALVVSDAAGLQATLDAFVATFDPTALTASEQQQEDDTLTLADLRAQYQTMKTGLGTIRTHMATIQASANPTTANLAALQRVVDAVKQEADGITTLCNGLDRLLDTLAVIVRQRSS